MQHHKNQKTKIEILRHKGENNTYQLGIVHIARNGEREGLPKCETLIATIHSQPHYYKYSNTQLAQMMVDAFNEKYPNFYFEQFEK